MCRSALLWYLDPCFFHCATIWLSTRRYWVVASFFTVSGYFFASLILGLHLPIFRTRTFCVPNIRKARIGTFPKDPNLEKIHSRMIAWSFQAKILKSSIFAWKTDFRLKISFSLENGIFAWNFHSRLKISFSLEIFILDCNFQPSWQLAGGDYVSPNCSSVFVIRAQVVELIWFFQTASFLSPYTSHPMFDEVGCGSLESSLPPKVRILLDWPNILLGPRS